MPRYNTKAPTTKTTNLAGGAAFDTSDEWKLVSLAATSFMQDQYYRSAEAAQSELATLCKSVDAKFAAQTAIYVRHELGMRSVSHYIAALIAPRLSGTDFGTNFYASVVRRPDDITEILAIHKHLTSQGPTNAMKKGFARAMERFDSYQLSKYRQADKAISLVDVVRLCHPKSTDAIKGLVYDNLRQTDTWESQLSQCTTDGEKCEVWRSLMESNKLGYFALLRNLRNILKVDDGTLVPLACERLTNTTAIKKSLVLPFRYMTAYEIMQQQDGSRQLLQAVSEACDISLGNLPMLAGKTVVAVDDSGSMGSSWRNPNSTPPIKHATMLGAALYKSQNADLYMYSDDARRVNMNPAVPALEMAYAMQQNLKCQGTNASSVLMRHNAPCDRFIFLTDEQTWKDSSYSSHRGFANNFREYERRHGNTAFYSVNLAGYGQSMMPKHKRLEVAGFSDRILTLIPLLEEEPNALINRARSIEL